jgi:cell division protein FtsI/penicillin-binding protein 2
MLGPEALAHYVKLFGFGSRTGIELPGEVGGVAKDFRQWSKTSITAVPMGQEVTVTALQLACALSTIANGGTLMRPYITMEIRTKNGEPGKSFKPLPVRSVISADTAARMRAILIGVIQNGTGKLALSKEFTAGGKTGTGQKLEPNGTYSHSKFMASFMGFAPAEDPQIVVVVVIDEPHGAYYGGVVSAPVFKEVAGDVLKYLKSKQEKDTFVDFDEMANTN